MQPIYIVAAVGIAALLVTILLQERKIAMLEKQLKDVKQERRFYLKAIRDAMTVTDVRGFLRHRIGMHMTSKTKETT